MPELLPQERVWATLGWTWGLGEVTSKIGTKYNCQYIYEKNSKI